MAPIRVLHVVTIMDRGGIETMLMTQYRNIDREKVQYDFLVHRPQRGAYDDEIESLGGRIFRANPLTPFGIPGYVGWLIKFFRTHPEYSIVHSSINELSGFVLMGAKKAGVKTRIAHSHIAKTDRDWKLFFRMIAKQFIPFVATHMFACSILAGDWCFGERNRSKVRVIPNAINAIEFRYNPEAREKLRGELGLSGNFVVGHVGRFFQQKNHFFLLDIFENIYHQDPNARLLLVGDGLLMEDVQKKAEVLGDAVVFAGIRSDMADLYQAMDAFVLPSYFEGLPVVGIEAQTAGLPCFFSDNVSDEVLVTSVSQKIPLSQGAKYWADKILENKNIDRIDHISEIVKARYDIAAVVHEMQDFYLRHGK